MPARGVTTLTTEAAMAVIARYSRYVLNGSVPLAHAVRVARANAHPDSRDTDGSHDAFIEVQAAEVALRAAGVLDP